MLPILSVGLQCVFRDRGVGIAADDAEGAGANDMGGQGAFFLDHSRGLDTLAVAEDGDFNFPSSD